MSTFPRTPQPRDHRAVIVIDAENQRRIAARQTACRREGHDWTDPRNVRTRPNGRRYCAECDRIAHRAKRSAV